MTIDAANFEPQGKPTPAQVKAVYEAMHVNGRPASSRKVHVELTKRGFDISHASVGRYIKNDFRDLTPPGSSKPVGEKLAQATTAAHKAANKKALKAATTLKRMDGPEVPGTAIVPQSGLQAAVAPVIDVVQLEEAQLLARIWRMRELMGMSEPQVQEVESKMRRALNIILMEESVYIGDRLAGVPKDTAQMVTAQAEAMATTTVYVPDPTKPQPGRLDPNHPSVIDNDSSDPLASSIGDFLRKEGIAA